MVSTVERGQTGLIAVGRSADVVQGRGALAFGVNFLVILVTGGVAFLYSYAVKSLQWEATCSLLFPVADFVFCGIAIFMEVFTLAVYTVFYRDCSSNPADELAVQENLIYNGVPSAASFNSLLGHPPLFVIRRENILSLMRARVRVGEKDSLPPLRVPTPREFREV